MQTVESVMTTSVVTVKPETPLSEVARILVDRRISGLPVVDAFGRVIGVVSEGDVLMREVGTANPSPRPLAHLFEAGHEPEPRGKAEARTAGEAMTSPVLTIEPYRAIRAAAEVMTEHHVNRLPVVDEDGKLIGIVTRADLVRAFVRSDEELVGDIRKELLVRTMWLDPDRFEIRVTHGVAYVKGAVTKRSTAEMIQRFLPLVPGVLSAETDIAWTEDDGGLTAS